MVDYRPLHIARIQLSGDQTLEGRVLKGVGPMELAISKFMTLMYAPGRGSRVFAVGANLPPDQILFSTGTSEED